MFLKYKNPNKNLQLPIRQLSIKKLQMYIDFHDVMHFQLHKLPSIRKTYCTLDSYKSLQSGTQNHCISQITHVTQSDITTFCGPDYLWDGSWQQKRSSNGRASQTLHGFLGVFFLVFCLALSLSMTLIFHLDIVRFCQNCASGRILKTEHPPGHLQEAVWAPVSWADVPECREVGNLLGLGFFSKFSSEQVSGFSVEVLIRNTAFFTPLQIFRSTTEN